MRRKRLPNYEILMTLDSVYQPTSSYRNMLDNIHKGCYVEAPSSQQYGIVQDIIRNRYGIPVCVKVYYGDDDSIDYISVDRVGLWEPYDEVLPDSEYFSTYEEDVEWFLSEGYRWDNEKGVFVNEDGDEIVW